MDAAPVYFWYSDGSAWIRVADPGTRLNAGAVGDFGKEAFKRGVHDYVIDLKECSEVDSTFLGTLALIALRLHERGIGKVRITNSCEAVKERLAYLGLDQLFESS